ncbi:MAG: hypothetical protein R1F52_05345 [Candidatus Nitrosoabyssus spongiisocia]|nr:MAG: hypothetical protein R1F52_05345 [Nitrosopumilaceae archaeon AB1(1)]
MNPLAHVDKSKQSGALPEKICDLIEKRFPLVVEGINRIEKASGINYPVAYVDPSVVIARGDTSSNQYGILYARTIPLTIDDKLKSVIQISAPLVAFGLKGTIHAILGHEFLHYLELMHRVSTMGIISDEISSSIFENTYSDSSRLLEPRAIFSDQTLVSHITKKFPSGFRDYKLEDKTLKFWLSCGLPRTNIDLDQNTTRLSVQMLSKVKLTSEFKEKLDMFVQKSTKIQKRQAHKLLQQI